MFNLKRVATFQWKILRVVFSIFIVFSVLSCAAAWTVGPELSADRSGALTIWLIDLLGPLGLFGFLFAVLIGALPGVIAVFVALALAADFVRGVYELKNWEEGREYLIRTLFGQPGFSPFLLVKEGGIVNPPEHVLRRVGGPGHMIIYNDSAVVTEQDGKLKRVLVGPGFPKLERFEKIWEVIDLRPRRWVLDVNAMTKEGILVTVPADVRFKIEDGGQEPTEKKPYPVQEEAVFAAATSKWVREPERSEPERVLDWAGRVIISDTEGTLRTIISHYYLDELIMPVSYKGYLCQAIWRELERELRPYDTDWPTRLAMERGERSPQQIREELKEKLNHYLKQLDETAGGTQKYLEARKRIDAIFNHYLNRLIFWPQQADQGRPRQVIWEELEEKLNPYLDRLAGLEMEEKDNHPPRQVIAEKLEDKLKESAPKLGAEIICVSVGEIRLDDEMFNQWLASWLAERESRSEGLLAERDAQMELTMGVTSAEVQRKLLAEIRRIFEGMGEGEKLELLRALSFHIRAGAMKGGPPIGSRGSIALTRQQVKNFMELFDSAAGQETRDVDALPGAEMSGEDD
jgi:regulator of protease activity HflC (stomatin/prohibitin superfamily)